MSVSYEWDVEKITLDEHEDIIDHDHADNLIDLKCHFPLEKDKRLVLVRDEFKDYDLQDRQWAYCNEAGLPIEFDGGSKVPKSFHDELLRFTKTGA